EIAHKLVEQVRDAGGIWTLKDLADYRVVEREPVRGNYRGIRVTAAAPPSSGGIGLVTMLNILHGYALEGLDPTTRTHLIIEAMRRAYRDRAQYLGDPDFVTFPLQQLIHPWYGAGLRASIRTDRATPSARLPGFKSKAEGTDTTHFSILDREGNRVAATLSINYGFGSGFSAAGVLLNDEMDDFSVKLGMPNAYGLVGAEANAIAPGKRPLSSMTPTFLESEQGVAILGTPGGSRIISMVLHGVLDFAAGNGPESWVAMPRFHHQFLPDEVQYEKAAFDAGMNVRLTKMGHNLRPLQKSYGNMQAVFWNTRTKRVQAASDPRGIGLALVQ
ncbi:MAG: gamma-glutamyltransferase, partial [Gammaproteobacteria bacterium]